MKNPSAFYVDSGKAYDVVQMTEYGEYSVLIDLTYYGTNSFGAYIREETTGYVSFFASDTDMKITTVKDVFFK